MTAVISSSERTELYRLLGLSEQPLTTPEPAWTEVKLRFIGAEYYVLGTKHVDAVLQHRGKGVSLLFKHRLEIPCDVLLGNQILHSKLFDVIVDFGGATMSLASLHPERYPIVLRRNKTVDLI